MMRYYSTPLRTAEIRDSDNTKSTFGKDAEKVYLSYIAGGNIKWYRHLTTVWQFLKKY